MSTQVTDWYQIDWDEWRREHASMTFEQQQAFYKRVAEFYPRQQSFDPLQCQRAFDAINWQGLTVLELGGWDGALAAIMLGRPDVTTWMNYDLLEVPQVCRHESYELVVLEDYIWNLPPIQAEVFVACHTIEHLSARELTKLLSWIRTPYVYLEAPLSMEGQDWTGYPGSHILPLGWAEVNRMMADCGYQWRCPNLWSYA